MKKFLTKSILFSVVFFGIGVIALLIVKASLLTANTGDKLTSAKRNDVINKVNSLETTLTALSSVPAGQVSAFYLASCPTGRIPANGSNSTPDLRGEFIRGLDSGRGIDTGRTLKSSQAASRIALDFVTAAGGYSENSYAGWRLADPGITDSNTENRSADLSMGNKVLILDSTGVGIYYTTSTKAVRADVRPRNVALLYCVKQ